MDNQNILITGFGPFEGHLINASWEAVKLLKNYNLPGYRLITNQVPVIYKSVDEFVPQAWEKYKPHIVVHVGVSSSAKAITLEQRANRTGYVRKDVSGEQHPTGEVVSEMEGANCLKTLFPIENICQKLTTDKVRFEMSQDAGRFLCEYIYYSSLHKCSQNTLFIHVPPLKTPYTVEELAEGIFQTINLLVEHVKDNENKIL